MKTGFAKIATFEFWAKFTRTEYWANQNRYIFLLCSLLTIFGILYVYFHDSDNQRTKNVGTSYELKKLSTDVLKQINSIVENNPQSNSNDSSQTANTSQDSSLAEVAKGDAKNANQVSDAVVNRIVDYISFNFPDWDSVNREALRRGITGLSKNSTITQLSSVKISIKSYFWLNGPITLLEIFFWSIFGVLTSLLYFITEDIRNKDPKIHFEPDQIPSHVAKLFYAPVVTMVIIFCYDYATGDSGTDLSVSKAILVVSFLLGFYSGRAMELLNRVKEVLLPYASEKGTKPADVNRDEPAGKKITINLELANSEMPPDTDYETVLNQLGTAVVKLIDKSNASEILLTKTGEDQEGLFVAENVVGNNYKLQASFVTTDNLSFVYEADIDLSTEDTFEIALKKDEVDG